MSLPAFFEGSSGDLGGAGFDELKATLKAAHTTREVKLRILEAALTDCRISTDARADLMNTLLEDEDASVRFWAAVHADCLADNRTVEILKAMIEGECPATKRAALSSLGSIAPSEVIPLMAKTQGPDEHLQHSALSILSHIGSKEALDGIRHVLRSHSNVSMRYCAALYLAYAGSSEGMGVLLSFLEDETLSQCDNQDLRHLGAVFALALLGHRSGIERLRAYLEPEAQMEDTQRQTLLFLIRKHLGFTGEDHDILLKTKEWLDSKSA